jgi:gamma-glutamyltranspeptidase/glutathione hydrolase
MLNTTRSLKGLVVAPHHLASQAGVRVLREGGTAVEAAVAVGAALTVVYPHMNSLGGDGFWLIAEPGKDPVGVDACGRAAAAADLWLYSEQGLAAIPWRGPLAANTVAGVVSGWEAALAATRGWGASLPLSRLFEDAIHYASDGVAVADGLAQTLAAKRAELADLPGFASTFLAMGQAPEAGTRLRQRALAATLQRLATDGLESFYRGGLAEDLAHDLAAVSAPVALPDLQAHRAAVVKPLSVAIRGARLFNMTPPTQGFASLMILALFDRLAAERADGFEHIHGLVEATKRAFILRDRHIGDPARMSFDPQAALDDSAALARLAAEIDPRQALPWPQPPAAGDTVWFGAMDAQGRAVSVIQSTYFEFGSGLVLPRTGVIWQNRGSSFRLTPGGPNALAPFAKPFHTLNPAMAQFSDGRLMSYGTMGGEGQPQTQAAIFSRYARFGQGLQQAVSAPRWLLGRTWGEESTSLKIEDRFPADVTDRLRAAGHAVEMVAPFTSLMGHAGALVRAPDGDLEGAADPRSDGAVAGW